jgi:uncharacterized protein
MLITEKLDVGLLDCWIKLKLWNLTKKIKLFKIKSTYRLLVFFLLLIFLSETVAAQFDIPPKPKTTEQTSLYDYINLLNASQQKALEAKLNRYADSTSTQIVVAIISSTNGEDISLLGAKWGQKWGIGQADKDNGILILLAKDDRQIDINTGYGIEYRITDRMAERIINRIIIPEFKAGSYYNGLNKGADAIFDALKGEFNENRDFSKETEPPLELIIIVIFIIIVIALSVKKNGRGGGNRGNRRGSSLLDFIILSNMGRTGGFGGSSNGGGSFGGGGGFGGGFGGGGFGGGGASGSW